MTQFQPNYSMKIVSKVMPSKTTGRKNKRGERGSTNDGTTDPKRIIRMVSSDFEHEDPVGREDDQPALSNIHALLIKRSPEINEQTI